MNTAVMTYEQAAAQLGMSVAWLRKQVAADLVPHTRLGRAVRFTAEQLAAILSSRAVEPPPRRHRRGPVLSSTTPPPGTPSPTWPPPSPPTPSGPANPPHETRKSSQAVAR